MAYKPGLHILSEIKTPEIALLNEYAEVRILLDEKIISYGLTKVGEVYHNFEGGGYTAVVCLTESHLALHTWPEYGILTLDIYLSNCKRINDDKSRKLFQDLIEFYKSESFSKTEVLR